MLFSHIISTKMTLCLSGCIIRKSVMSIKVPPVILGPEMAAPILWAPGFFGLFLLENPYVHKIPPFRGGCWVFYKGGGGSANFIFMGVGIFSSICNGEINRKSQGRISNKSFLRTFPQICLCNGHAFFWRILYLQLETHFPQKKHLSVINLDITVLGKETMTMTNIPSQKVCVTYGHGPLKFAS